MSACIVCKSPAVRLREFYLNPTNHIFLRRCSGCGAEFLDPQPDDALLTEQYTSYFERRNKFIVDRKEVYFDQILSALQLPKEGPLRILEIGSGEGLFIEALHRNHPNAEIVAVEQEDCQNGNEGRAEIHATTIEKWLTYYQGAKFDLICGFDLFEHLRQPCEVFKALVGNHLSDKGKLVATMPYVSSWSRTLMGRMWLHYKVEHLWYPSRKSLEEIESIVGVKRVVLRANRKTLSIGYVIAILNQFGPAVMQKLGRIVRAIVPRKLDAFTISFFSGEVFWVIQRGNRR